MNCCPTHFWVMEKEEISFKQAEFEVMVNIYIEMST